MEFFFVGVNTAVVGRCSKQLVAGSLLAACPTHLILLEFSIFIEMYLSTYAMFVV
jgi:hypothetical protein